MSFEEHLARWEQLHGVQASLVVRAWLRLVHALARRTPLPPDALTLLAVVVAAAALPAPRAVAAGLVVLSSLLDGLDGAVAVVTGRVTARGARLDAVGDRLCDGLFLALLVLAGAPWWLAIACAAGVLALEGTRVVVRRPVTVTVGERPTRVIATMVGLLVAPTVALAVLAAATAVALVQLTVALRR